MRTEFRNGDGGLVGVVSLDADGVARLETGGLLLPDFLDGVNVIRPGAVKVEPAEGESYLRALPFAFRGNGYLSARFVATP